MGIIHQVNLEFLAKCVFLRPDAAGTVALPDTLVGTDSHTTMINGLGVVGWGVGGIEAEAVMLGQPLYMLAPEVIGFELRGQLPPGATATDLVLTVTQILRKEGVVDKFVEFCGPALANMTVADRALVANMAPEYGATMGFFPTDEQTLSYLRETGRSDEEVALVERYTKEQQLFRSLAAADASASQPRYTKLLQLDLTTIEPSLAGPKRPQDRVPLGDVQREFRRALQLPVKQRGFALSDQQAAQTAQVAGGGTIGHGAVVIASITSCTNTSNPAVMLAAGLLARNAVQRGLKVKPHVKTSLAPGSRVVTDYLELSGLDKPLEQLGFHTVGYGCMTCIGNSGPLPEAVAEAVGAGQLVAAAVLSGNRNFEGRINPLVKANYLASPPLVVAYALAGTVDIDLTSRTAGRRQRRPPGVLEGYLAQPGGNRGHGVPRDPARDVPQAIRQRADGQRDVEPHLGSAERVVPLGPREHVHPGAAVLAGPGRRAGSDPADPRRSRVGRLGRLGDDRPHFARRLDRRQQPGRQILAGAGRRAGRFQQLRIAAGQRSGDGAGHVRQYPHPQPIGRRRRRRRYPAPARRPTHGDLRRRHEIQGRRRAAAWCWPGPNTAPAAAATGPPKGRTCWAFGR